MNSTTKIESIAIIAKLDDGTTREILLTSKQKMVVLDTLTEYLKPEKLSVSDPIDGIQISP